MSLTVYRVERDGTETEIAYIDGLDELGTVITEDRDKIDYEATYRYDDNDKVANHYEAVI